MLLPAFLHFHCWYFIKNLKPAELFLCCRICYGLFEFGKSKSLMGLKLFYRLFLVQCLMHWQFINGVLVMSPCIPRISMCATHGGILYWNV